MTLCEKTLSLLKACPQTYPDIANQTGLSFYWLSEFGKGRIKDPSVNRVQKLYEYLSGNKLNY